MHIYLFIYFYRHERANSGNLLLPKGYTAIQCQSKDMDSETYILSVVLTFFPTQV